MRGLRWLVIRVAALWIVFAVAISGAILIGRRQPIPDRIALLHLNDCELPCWIGIIPGKTTLAEAQQRIRQIYGNIPGYQISDTDTGIAVTNQAGDDRLEIIFARQNVVGTQTTFDELDLRRYNPSGDPDIHVPTIADLFVVVESPSWMTLKYGEGTLYSALLFDKDNLEVPFESDNTCVKPSMDAQIDLTFYNQMPSENDPVYYAIEPWHGFRSSCYDLNPKTP